MAVAIELGMPIIEADDLFKFYHPGDAEVRALRGVSLSVAAGEIVTLLGPSGSGKSTLLACLAGLDEPDAGMVIVAGRRMSRRPERERTAIRAASIGFLAQSENLFQHLTVEENIRLPMDLIGKRDPKRIDDLLGLVGLLNRAKALPSTLSGGELSRASLAVALAVDPPLLLADEPTAEVDADTECRILELLEERRVKGGAALIATHSPGLSAAATRVLRLADGLVAEAVAPKRTAPVLITTENENGSRSEPRGISRPLIKMKQVSRTFRSGASEVRAVVGASCRVLEDDRIAISGPSGSGKSTLLNLMAQLEKPSVGTVSWPGLGDHDALRPTQIGFVFQAPSLLPALTVIENVRLALEIAVPRPNETMSPKEALERLLLLDLAEKLPDELSAGQMQRVACARALVTRPKVILADEPTGQLDQVTGQQLVDALFAALQGTGTALVVATHDAAIAGRLDRQWRMDAGVLQGDMREGKAA
jgi:ABC-type lipoprotein export system ATPase subunit